MEKKKWQNAEILELGVESTKDEVNGSEKMIYKCQYCEERFWTKDGRKKHEENCAFGHAAEGFGPNGNVTPGLDYTPPIS